MTTTETDTAFKRWYEKNREKLADKRKQRYETDPVYREKVLKRSQSYREHKREQAPKPPGGYVLTQTMVSEDIGVSDAVIRQWIQRGYMPEPKTVNRRRYFTQSQCNLLRSLVQYFVNGGKHLTKDGEPAALQNLVNAIFANW